MSQRIEKVPGKETSSEPSSVSATSRTAMSIWSNAEATPDSNRVPASVSRSAFFGPSNRATPSDVSRCCTCRLMALCVTFNSWAAKVMRPCRLAASNARRAFSETGRRM